MLSSADKSGAFVLASVLTGYPDRSYAASVETLLSDKTVLDTFNAVAAADWDELRRLLGETLSNAERFNDLASEYIDTFDRGRNANPLYETEYGRERAMVKGNELVDIAGFYKAFGLEFDGDSSAKEMLDHVSVELEFYALLLMKQAVLEERRDVSGVSIVEDARKKFLTDHLGRFVAAIAQRPGVRESEFYSRVFECSRALIEKECEALGVVPVQASWVAASTESPEMACGSAGCSA